MSVPLSIDQIREVVREELRAVLAESAPTAKPLSAADACRYLGVSRYTLQAWMKARRLPIRRIHGNRGRLYFFRNELDEALKRFGRKAAWQP